MLRAHRFLPLAFAVATLATAPACASPGYYGYPAPRPVDQRPYQVGYENGRVQGENDARRGRRYDYDDHREFRSADIGYHGYGSRNAYREEFRQGFVAGYSDGFRRFAPYDGSYPPPRPGTVYGDVRRGPSAVVVSPAAQIGYRDGLAQGRDDAHDRDRFNPTGAGRYRDGDHEYNNRYGSRDEYKREYRSAFTRGYEAGYREYRR